MYVLPSSGVPAESSFPLETHPSDPVRREHSYSPSYGNNSLPSTTRYFLRANDFGIEAFDDTGVEVRLAPNGPPIKQNLTFLYDFNEVTHRLSGSPTHEYRLPVDVSKFQNLCFHLNQCQSYLKYRFDADRSEGNDMKKWPQHIEKIFWYAVLHTAQTGAVYRAQRTPAWRKGQPLPYLKKTLGRNELVALYIGDWFGIPAEATLRQRKKGEPLGNKKDRKWISSHLQVVRKFLMDIPFFKWLLEDGKEGKLSKCGIATRASTRTNLAKSIVARTACCRLPIEPLQRRPLLHAAHVLPSQGKFHYPTILKSHKFGMYIQHPQCQATTPYHKCSQDRYSCEFDTIKTITQLQKGHDMAAIRLEEHLGWQSQLPYLEEIVQKDQFACDVLLAESSFSLMTDRLPDKCNLVIINAFTIDRSWEHMQDWHCRTSIFENGQIPIVEDDSNRRHSQITPDPDDSSLLDIKLNSRYWVTKLGNLLGRLRSAEEAVEDDVAASRDASKSILRKVQEEVRNELKNITVVQEIFVNQPLGIHRKRALIIYWKFNQTDRNAMGFTTWRTLIPPHRHQGSSRFLLERNGVKDNVMRPDLDFNTPLATGSVIEPHAHSFSSMPSQHDVAISTSEAFFDPVNFEYGVTHADAVVAPYMEQLDVLDHTLAGAEMVHAMTFATSVPLNLSMTEVMDPAIIADGVVEPIHDYDSTDLEHVADPPIEESPHLNRSHTQGDGEYVPVNFMQEYENIMGDQIGDFPKGYAGQFNLSQPQQSILYPADHQYATFDALFGDTVVGPWLLTQQEQQLHLQSLRVEDMSAASGFHPVPGPTQLALQAVQDQGQSVHRHDDHIARDAEEWEQIVLEELEAAEQSAMDHRDSSSVLGVLPSVLQR